MLAQVDGAPDSLHQLVIGVDQQPRELGPQEIAQLGDDLAQLAFARGVFPKSAGEALQVLATEPNGRFTEQRPFFVSEEGQLPGAAARPRFIVIAGNAPSGPDVFVSAAHPTTESVVEIMAWDHRRGGFNYYQRTADGPWVHAGNSADAFGESSAGKGPFESHPSGNVIMKELRFPWVHWNSFAATIRADVVSPDTASNPWFIGAGGAEALETAVMASIQRWAAARLDAGLNIRDVVAPFLRPTTVNLVSSKTESGGILSGAVADFDVPHAFFVDSETLHGVLGLPAPDPSAFRIPSGSYRAVLERHEVALRANGTTVPSDTHFAFVVPERAFEDITMVRLAIDRGLVTKRLAACLLMVDFPNPVFSDRRAALLRHVPDAAASPQLSDTVADAILASPASQEAGSAEGEFRELWESGDDGWRQACANRLTAYSNGLAAELGNPNLDHLFALAEQRRDRVREMPIHESPLLFATPNKPPPAAVSAHPDGTIR